MSLSLTLTETIDKVIETFITKVSEQYNLEKKELRYLWDGKEVKTTKTEKSPVSKAVPDEVDPEALLKCSKAELIAMCKARGHKCSGTKSVLLGRLLNKEEAPAKKKTSSKEKKHPEKTPVAKKLSANIPNILIRRNQFNNYEHPETGLVFDNKDRVVIGKQNDDGTIDDLTEEDIDQCNAFKFKYKIPVNLDHKSTLANVKVDELSDEDEESDEEDNEELVAEEDDEEEGLEIEDEDEDEDEDEEELLEEELLGDDEEFEEEYEEDD